MNWMWILLVGAGLIAAWWALKIILAVTMPPEVTGRALLKQQLKRNGIEVSRIPDSAIDEIVQHCLKVAKGLAWASTVSPSYRHQQNKNWRANLVQQLQTHAIQIGIVMRGERPSPAEELIREILVRNGLVQK